MASDRTYRLVATCLYVGYLKFAPGTWASAFACIVLYFVHGFTNPVLIAAVAAIGFFSIEKIRGEERDPGYVVVDEFVGMQLTMWGHAISPMNLIGGFILFRAFDILKPYPIRRLERLPGAYGIMADDVAAGLAASIVLFIWERIV